MDNLRLKIQKLFELMGFNEPTVSCDIDGNKIAIFVNEGDWFKEILPKLILETEHITRLMSKKESLDNVFVDINNYRKEREGLIINLANASARKALLSKEEIKLPPMNAYERRLVHLELSVRPDVKTESVGEGRERYVVVRPL